MLLNSVLNTLCKVSVSTNVPAMKVTPRTIANAVRPRRSLCASRPLIVTVHMSGTQRPHSLQDRVGGRAYQFVDDAPVSEEDDPIRIGRAAGIVGDHDDRLPEVVD